MGLIFIGSQVWMKNYDQRYNESGTGEATVLDKEFLPKGNYTVSVMVGKIVRQNQTWMPDRYNIILKVQQ